MLSFFLTLLIIVVVSFLPERCLKPKPPSPSLKAILIQASLVTMVFLSLTLIVQRAVFSGIAVFIFLIILVAVNNAKYKALNEPMVFSDFAMFSQAFKHPRLYFPFLGLLPVILAPLIIIGLIITVLKLEPALAFTWQRILASVVAILMLFFVSKKLASSLTLSTNPKEDNVRYGLQSTLFAYTLYAATREHKKLINDALKTSPFFSNKPPPPFFTFLSESDQAKHQAEHQGHQDKHQEKPNITVIQSESFFDARRLHSSIKTDVLKNFDRICAESVQYGQLKVPAWGANTMRTEYAFLSGIDNKKMALYRFYPYQFLSNSPVSSIASALKAQGYYCVCIHPHPASFFGRDRLFPALGFDEFIDADYFEKAEKFGPYISDQSVTDKIIKVTKEKTDKPLFIFVITMENHGPLHLEKTTSDEQESYFTENFSTKSFATKNSLGKVNDLAVYLRHLSNADKMLQTLTEAFNNSEKAHSLCFYGDHIPSMPNIYQQMNYDNHNSDYIIWNNRKSVKKPQATIKSTLAVEHLARHLLDVSNEYRA